MKKLLRIAVIGLAANLSLGTFRAVAELEVAASVQISARTDFDAPLAAHGIWVEIGPHGRCWRPARVAAGWRPYSDGEWVWTDCGWYWQSDEPWAWACYHYGRWNYDPAHGWYWIPDVEWAPAWVYWRTGGGYIGWAPSPPHGVIVQPAFFAFVDVGRFHHRIHPKTVIVNDTAIINKTTTEITEIKHETRNIGGSTRKVVVNHGPGVEPVEKAARRTIHPVSIQEAAGRTRVPSEVAHKSSEPGKERPAATTQQPAQPAGKRTDRETPRTHQQQPATPPANQEQQKIQPQPPAQFKPDRPHDAASPPPTKPAVPPNAPKEKIVVPPNAPREGVAPAQPRREPVAPPSQPPSRGHVVPPSTPSQPPPSAPAMPAEPAPGSDKGHERGKGPGHEKEKSP